MAPALLSLVALVLILGVYGQAEGLPWLLGETAAALFLVAVLTRRKPATRPDWLFVALGLAETAGIVLARETIGPIRALETLPDLASFWHLFHVGVLTTLVIARVGGATSSQIGLALAAALCTGNYTLFCLDVETHVPDYLPAGPALALSLSLALLLSARQEAPRSRLLVPSALFLGTQWISAFAGAHVFQSALGCTWVLASLALFQVVRRTERGASLIQTTLGVSGWFVGALLLGRFLWMLFDIGPGEALSSRQGLPNVHPNAAGAWLAVALPLIAAKAWKKPAWQPVAILAVAGLILTYSRLAWVAAAFGLAILGWLTSARRGGRSLASIGALGLVIVALVASTVVGCGTLGRRLGDVQSLGERGTFVRSAIRTFREHPILGIGANDHQIQTAYADPHAPQPAGMRSSYTFDDPHNVVLDVAQGSGLLGLAALAWLVLEVLRRLSTGWKTGASLDDRAAVAAVGALGFLILGDMAVAKHSILPVALFLLLGTFPEEGPSWKPRRALGTALRASAYAAFLCLAVRPALASIAIHRGWDLGIADQPEAASRAWRWAARCLPEDARTHWQLGLARLRAADLEGAQHSLARAVDRFPRFGLLNAQRGLVEIIAGETDRGRADLARAAALDPTGAVTFWFESPQMALGAAENERGNTARAAEAFLDALRSEPVYGLADYWAGGGAPAPVLIRSDAFRVPRGDRRALKLFALSRLLPEYFPQREIDPLMPIGFDGQTVPSRQAIVAELSREARDSLAAGRSDLATRIFDRVVQDQVYLGSPGAAVQALAAEGYRGEDEIRIFRVPGYRGQHLFEEGRAALWLVEDDGRPPLPRIDQRETGFAYAVLADDAAARGDESRSLGFRRIALVLDRSPERYAEYAEGLVRQGVLSSASKVAIKGIRSMLHRRQASPDVLRRFLEIARLDPAASRRVVGLIGGSVARAPWIPALHAARIEALRFWARAPEALAAAHEAVSACPESAWMWLFLSQEGESAGDLETARRAAEKAYELDPDSPHVWVRLAHLLIDGGDTGRAKALLDRRGPCYPGSALVAQVAERLGAPVPNGACEPALLERLDQGARRDPWGLQS